MYSNRSHIRKPTGYFTELTVSKGLLYTVAGFYVGYCSIACFLIEPFMDFCENSTPTNLGFENPAYREDACHQQRYPILLWLTLEECSFGRRIASAAILGGLIGWERRAEDRPAGIRTMALVSLGSCLFSICSAFAFLGGPMTWDGSRVSAAIPSGVGFLGAGLIFKNAEKDENGETMHSVHGITTAASLWISAAVGIACGGELYFAATHSVAVLLLLLRFGPRSDELMDKEIEQSAGPNLPSIPGINFNASFDPEMQPLNKARFGHESPPPTPRQTVTMSRPPSITISRPPSPVSGMGVGYGTGAGAGAGASVGTGAHLARQNSVMSGVASLATHRSKAGRPKLME